MVTVCQNVNRLKNWDHSTHSRQHSLFLDHQLKTIMGIVVPKQQRMIFSNRSETDNKFETLKTPYSIPSNMNNNNQSK